MRFSLLALLLLPSCIFAESKKPLISPEWLACKTDPDCVIVSNECGWPVAPAAKAYEKQSSEKYRIAGAAISCVSWNETKMERHEAYCEKGTCQARLISARKP